MHAHTHAHTCAHTYKYTHSKWHQGREQIRFAISLLKLSFCNRPEQQQKNAWGEGNATMVLLLLFEVIHGELDFNLTAGLVTLGGSHAR